MAQNDMGWGGASPGETRLSHHIRIKDALARQEAPFLKQTAPSYATYVILNAVKDLGQRGLPPDSSPLRMVQNDMIWDGASP